MLNIKIYKILSLIDAPTRNRFGKYVSSPYFNNNDELISLFKNYRDAIKSDVLLDDKELIWFSVYPKNSTYDDKKLRQLNTKLLSLFEDFIAQEKYNKNPFNKVLLQLEQLQDSNYQLIENQIVKNSSTIGKRYEELSSIYHLNMFQIENSYYKLTKDWQKKSKKKSKVEKFNFERILNHLDIFYLAEKLKFIYSQLFWESYNPGDKSDLLNDEILEIVNKGKFRSNPLLLSHYYAIRTITNPDKKSYYNGLKSLVFDNYSDFDPYTIRFFYECLLTYSIRRVNAGHKNFETEVFELYKIGLKRNLFLVDNLMSIISFRNIIGIALKQKAFDWTSSFILEYSSFLPHEQKENAVNFNLARIHFYQKDFNEALTTLNQVDLEDIHYALNARTLLVAVYFELNEFDAMLSSIDSFRVFLNRTKILKKDRIDNFKNYLKYAKRIAFLESNDKHKLEKIYNDVKSNRMVNKQWILDKIIAYGYTPVSIDS